MPENLSQKEKFIQAAKELECNESEKAFNKKLKSVAKNVSARSTKEQN